MTTNEKRNKRLVHTLVTACTFLLVGILFTYGVLAVSGFSSVTVICNPNGTAEVENTSQFSGAIILLLGIFIGPTLLLLYGRLKQEYKKRQRSV